MDDVPPDLRAFQGYVGGKPSGRTEPIIIHRAPFNRVGGGD